MKISDFYRCYNELNSKDLTLACKAMKEALKTPKLVGLMHGYVDMASTRSFSPEFGHLAGLNTATSPYVDFVHGPHTYFNRNFGDGTHLSRLATATWHQYGKLVIDQFDFGTHYVPEHNAIHRRTLPQTLENIKRGVAHNIQTNASFYWHEGGPGNYDSYAGQGPSIGVKLHYDHPEYNKLIRAMSELTRQNQNEKNSSVAEIALVQSTMNMCDINLHDVRQVTNLFSGYFRSMPMAEIGAPFDEIYLEDFANVKKAYKLYIFPTAFNVNSEARKAIKEKLQREGATALWLYAPGYLDENGPNIANCEDLTGFKLDRIDKFQHITVQIDEANSPVTAAIPETQLQYGSNISREDIVSRCGHWPPAEYFELKTTFFSTDEDAQVLGKLTELQKDGLVMKKVGAVNSVYSAAPFVPSKLMQNLLHEAGGHIYSQQGDLVYANSGYVSVVARKDGSHHVDLPKQHTVVNALTGVVVAENVSRFSFDASYGETTIFKLQQPKATLL